MSFIKELKRRNVIRVGIAYAVGAWLLAQAADLVLDVMGAPDIILQSLVAILALGFIPAVIFAWAFEITPEGIKKEKDVDRTRSITNQTAKKLDIATMVLVVGAVILLALDRLVIPSGPDNPLQQNTAVDTTHTDSPEPEEAVGGRLAVENPPGGNPTRQKSLAVLPFVDMSPAKDNEYFTDGLTEELLNILAQIKSLQVAGRTSSFAFKGKTEDLREIGEKLNVNTLLEGSVRKDDKRQKIRVTVQLINAEDGYHIWSDTYDRDLEDIFAIQEDIARKVADALKINLLGEEATPLAQHARTGMNAYDLYLQGLQDLNLYTFDSLRNAEQLFTQSLAIDPDYQSTQLALVRTWLDLAETGAVPYKSAREKAEPLIAAILAEDPGNSDAHTYRAIIQSAQEQFDAAQKSYSLALESNPRNAYALMEFGRFLFNRGKIDDGLELLHTASSIEPYDMKVQWELCITQAMLGNVAGATRECQRIGEIQPGNPMEYYGQSFAHLFRGEYAQFLAWQLKGIAADPADPELPAGMALAWLDLGDSKQADKWLQIAAQIDPDQPFVVATRIMSLVYQEQFQQAVALAQQAHDRKLSDRQGSAGTIARTIVNDAIDRRDYARALEVLNLRLPEGIESPLDAHDAADAIVLASMAMVIKLQDPSSDRIAALLQHAEELNRQSSDRVISFQKPFRQAMIESARGNKQAAISSLNTAFERGWRWEWHLWLHRDYQFEPLHDEPEFKKLTAMLEADMEKQRQEAHQLLNIKGDGAN